VEVEREIKNPLKNNVLLLAQRQDFPAGIYPNSYRTAQTTLLFRNTTTISLCLCRVTTALHYVMQSQTDSSRLASGPYEIGLFFFYKFICLMPDDSLVQNIHIWQPRTEDIHFA